MQRDEQRRPAAHLHRRGRPLPGPGRSTRRSSLKARELGLAGATVLRGPMGFGHSSRLHTTKILRLSADLPLVIEIVDRQERIDAFLPELDRMMGSGLVTLENVRIRQYGPSAHADS